MIYPKYLRLTCALVALVVVGCATAQSTPAPSISNVQPTLVPSTPTVRATSSAPTESNTVSAPTTSAPATLVSPASSAGEQWNFENDAVGGSPKGAEVFSGAWIVRAETDAPSKPNAVCQTSTATYPAMSLASVAYTDLVASVRFKPISGNTDRAAGIIFRIQDKDNYYIVRANALEDNVIIFKYVRGSRSTIKEGAGKVATGQWQELSVEVSGNRIRGLLNGAAVVEATDDTFKLAGKIGLWTKADSVTCFDNVQVTGR